MSMADEGRRRASAHVERDSSGFDLAGLGNMGSIGSGGSAAGGGAGGNVADRRRSTSYLPSASFHAPEMLVNDEDNELFMSDEFRMYCYKVKNRTLFLFLFASSSQERRLPRVFHSSFFGALSWLARMRSRLGPTARGTARSLCVPEDRL